MSKPKQAVILCGGRGSRLMPHTKTTPKPMILCSNKPFLWHLLNQLSDQGISRFVLLTGYLGEQIKNYFRDGSYWGWEIQYSSGPVEWDTAKRIWESSELLDGVFLLLYSDNFVLFSLDKLSEKFRQSKKALTLIVTSKIPGNISIDNSENILQYNNNRSSDYLNLVELGYMVIEKNRVLSYFDSSNNSFSNVLKDLVLNNEVSCIVHYGPYHSISDPRRWKLAEKYLMNNKILLIDRDGVINKKAPKGEYISTWQDFKWIQETRDALKVLAKKGFKFIVITNQAGVARGLINPFELDNIHNKMLNELYQDGVEVIDIYVCTHHWNDGCSCRKPEAGMLYQASKDWLFKLDKTFFIGDDSRDCQAAFKGQCKSIFIGDKLDLKNLETEEMPAFIFNKLDDGIQAILDYY